MIQLLGLGAQRRATRSFPELPDPIAMHRFLRDVVLLVITAGALPAGEPVLVPRIDGDFWQVAGDPDLGKYTTPTQQPVDFAVWQAADGTCQLWSCVRGTAAKGKTRLFYRWQGANLTDRDWRPMGIAMEADPNFGETEGGLQAPYVLKHQGSYYMFYGDWEHICLAKSMDGKTFARQLTPEGKSGMFSEGPGANTRDPMALLVGDQFYLYYTACPNRSGSVFLRKSSDLIHWSSSVQVSHGGSGGDGPWSAECPFVYFHKPSGYYYLLRNQRYGAQAQFSVYRSKDPENFGVDTDRCLVGTMPYAAPEIIEHAGQTYLATLRADLKGIQIARLKWVPKPEGPSH
jgi:hypothetical protein